MNVEKDGKEVYEAPNAVVYYFKIDRNLLSGGGGSSSGGSYGYGDDEDFED